jgi:hypothetical protein
MRRREPAAPASPPDRRATVPASPSPRPRPSGPRGVRAVPGQARHRASAAEGAPQDPRAARRLPDNRYVPHIPVISTGYTPRQRAVIRQTLRSAAKRGGYGSLEDLYRAASPRQRQQLRRVGRIVTYGPEVARDPQAIAGLREHNLRDTVRARERYPLGRKALQGAGLLLDPSHGKLLRAGGATAYNVGAAFRESPSRVLATSLRTGRESITGIPQGIKALADNPVKAVEMIVKDYEDRYGSALSNPRKFRERVKSEWGLTPYVFDAAAAAGGGGQVLGRFATTSRFGRAAAALERSRVPGARAARAAHETMASERPALRFSGRGAGGSSSDTVEEPVRRSRPASPGRVARAGARQAVAAGPGEGARPGGPPWRGHTEDERPHRAQPTGERRDQDVHGPCRPRPGRRAVAYPSAAADASGPDGQPDARPPEQADAQGAARGPRDVRPRRARRP